MTQPRAARLSPDGYVAQRMDDSINGQGNWLLTYADKENVQIGLQVFTDEQVSDWPLLTLTQ